jgi:hypothetical protein
MSTPVREVTQFSMAEFKAWKEKAGDRLATTKEQFMCTFDVFADKPDHWGDLGGLDNIARVRCFGNPADATCRFDFVTKLPPSLVAQKKREEERRALMAKAEALKADPKALREFATTVMFAVLGRAALELLEASKTTKKPAKKPFPKRPLRKPASTYVIPAKTMDAFSAALAQDKRNRIEAAKKAAAEFKAKKEVKA